MNFIFNEATYVEDLFFYYPDKKLYTKGDGHCGFYTLSLLLCGTPEYHYQLRNIIANHIIYSPINLEEFVWWEDARELAYKDLETDTTKYTNNWMRSIHLAAAADLFGCNILVKCQDRLGWECYNFTTFNYGRNNTIFQSELPCLLIDNSSGNHFEPVITVKKGC
uniref:OTU domain-containing protein n=1 Tax=Panagrolaimus davidi TaxID=227884 RepID=A0A914PST3_9BILA